MNTQRMNYIIASFFVLIFFLIVTYTFYLLSDLLFSIPLPYLISVISILSIFLGNFVYDKESKEGGSEGH
jgi:hypothetical protein